MTKRTGTIARDEKGRTKEFEPTPEQRAMVMKLTGIGCTMEDIQQVVPWGRPDDQPISLVTMRKHFKAELKRGRPIADSRLRGKMFDSAMKGNTAVLLFFARARLGMKETQVVESVGKDGAPLMPGAILYLPSKDVVPEAPVLAQARASGAGVGVRAAIEGETPSRAAVRVTAPRAGDSEPTAHGTIEPVNEHISKRYRI